jgi:membrane peptidoglycan carboxypeptidase
MQREEEKDFEKNRKLPFAFPKEDRFYLDSPQKADDDKQLIIAIPSSSKVGTGLVHKTYNAENYSNQNPIGKKIHNNFGKGIRKVRMLFSTPVERVGRKLSVGLLLFLTVLVILNGFLLGYLVDLWTNSPSLEQFLKKPVQSSVVFARDGKTRIYEFYKEERREFVPIYKIPKVMQLAVISLEDENFYKNDQGIPWKNLAGSIQKCLTSGGENCRGGSGLSQQLVKVMTNKKEVTADRKLRELVSAIKLNQETNRTEVLEAYLNWVAFGRNSYGVEQASKSYFGKSISDKVNNTFSLSTVEACFLAAIIQSPGYYPTGIGKPDSQPWKELTFRKDACLNKLATLDLPVDDDGNIGKYIKTPEELEQLQNQPIESVSNKDAADTRKLNNVAIVKQTTEDPFPHFREYIAQELTRLYGEQALYEGGLRITTTLDPEIQKQTQAVVSGAEKKLNAVGATNAGALVLDGPTGEILAMVGSLDYDNEKIDGKVNMTTAPRQPGSSIKPYVYANAWRNGFNPATILDDKPETWKDYKPGNFSGRFSGLVSMRYALQNSLNIPAVKALLLGSPEKSALGYESNPNDKTEQILNGFFNFTAKTGLTFPCIPVGDGAKCNDYKTAQNAYRSRCFLSTALGGCEVKMIDHATGINTFLQEGSLRTANPFISILIKDDADKDLDILKPKQQQFYPKLDKAIDPLLARQVANVMSDYSGRINEFGNLRFMLELKDKAWKVAAKTGTSNGPKDFWVVGGSPYYTTTIWAGRNDSKDMSNDASSSSSAAFIWNEIMENLHKNKQVRNFSTQDLYKTEVREKTNEFLSPNQKIFLKEKGGFVEPPKP